MKYDAWGNTITTNSNTAASHYNNTVSDYLSFSVDTGDHLKAALNADPELMLGHYVFGVFFLLFGVPVLALRAQKSLQTARDIADKRGASDRERALLEALAAWCHGDLIAARDRYDAILRDHPFDPLSTRLAQFLHFYTEGSKGMLASSNIVIAKWRPELPGYGYVLGLHAFSLEEAGEYAAAEKCGREAVERNSDDIWATHAVTHVMEMQGRTQDGVKWVIGLEDNFPKANNFAFHLWWHRALFYLEQGKYDEVLVKYDTEIRADESDEYLDLTNAIAMLWRLQARGVDVGQRWGELADKAESHIGDNYMSFADAHYVLALAADGRSDALQRMIDAMASDEIGIRPHQIEVHHDIAVPIAKAALADQVGDTDVATDLLYPIKDQIWRLGGSHAQRDLFAQMLNQAAVNSSKSHLAASLLTARAEEKAARSNQPAYT